MTRNTFFPALFCTAMFCPAVLFAQGIGKPEITNIPGGLFVKWSAPVDVAAVQVSRNLSGPIEIMFDVPDVDFITNIIDRRTPIRNRPEMITALADYWIVRGKPERAIPLYEEGLKQPNLEDGRALVFQNNLAMLYSRTLGEHSKGLDIIDEALQTRRDNVVLLDTKGLIHLNAGNPAEAVPVLERAVVLSCELPIYCMHLAYALHQESRFGRSREFFDKVRDKLTDAAPNMTKENKEMFDYLQLALPPVDSQ